MSTAEVYEASLQDQNFPPQLTVTESGQLYETKEIPGEPGVIQQTLLPLVEIQPVAEGLPQASEVLRQLAANFENKDPMIHFLAQHGVFVWTEENNVGVHIKREHGRDHEARITARPAELGLELDMVWQNGSGPYGIRLEGEVLPPELVTSLNEIIAIEKKRRQQIGSVAAWHSQYSAHQFHRAYRTHMSKDG